MENSEMNVNNRLCVVILAAGSSKRLGKPKQLLHYKGESLLQLAVKKALLLSDDVFVVLGHEQEACQKELEALNVQCIYNSDYEKGMGTSLSLGIEQAFSFQHTLVMLCDQPFIPLEHFQTMIQLLEHNQIIATLVDGKVMVPAVFSKKYYSELLNLNGDKGARELLKNEVCLVVPIESSLYADIDTQEDVNTHLS